MAVEATIGTDISPLFSMAGPSSVGKMSDGTLIYIVGANLSSLFYVYRSVNSGSSWFVALVSFVPAGGDYTTIKACLIQDDKIYIIASDNPGLKYYVKRIDYSGGTFTVGVNDAVVFSDLSAGSVADRGCIVKEPGGRLWCLRNVFDNTGAQYRIQAAYSDNNAATWTFSATLVSSSSSSLMIPFAVILDKNLVVAYPNSTNIKTHSRLHTDGVSSWGIATNQLSVVSGAAKVHGASSSVTPSKNAFIVANDSSSSGTIVGLQIVETGSSLSYSSIGTFSIISSNTVVSGRSNGWRVISLRSADTTHLRVHLVGLSDTVWPSFSDTTITNAFDDILRTSTIKNLLNNKEDGADLTTWWFSGGASTVYSLTSLPNPESLFTRKVPISWFNLPAFFRSIAIEWTSNKLIQFRVPVEWISSFSFFVRNIPAAWTGNILTTRSVPISWYTAPPQTFKRSAAITWTSLAAFNKILPVGWTVIATVDLWLIITSPEGDSWAVLPTVAEGDTWTSLTPPSSDTWS